MGSAGSGMGRWWWRGCGGPGGRSRGGVACSGACAARRGGSCSADSCAGDDRPGDPGWDAGGAAPKLRHDCVTLSPRLVHRARIRARLGVHRWTVRNPVPVWVLARLDGTPRASRRPRSRAGVFAARGRRAQCHEPSRARAPGNACDGLVVGRYRGRASRLA